MSIRTPAIKNLYQFSMMEKYEYHWVQIRPDYFTRTRYATLSHDVPALEELPTLTGFWGWPCESDDPDIFEMFIDSSRHFYRGASGVDPEWAWFKKSDVLWVH